MIRLENITTRYFSSVSFEIKGGSACKIITSSDDEKTILLNTILGIRRPISGRVFLLGKDIYSIPEKEYIKLLKRIGVVLEYGGIISNLKVWENIILSVWHHMGKRPRDVEERVIEIFKEMGMDPSYLKELMGRLPGPLPVYEKRLIGLVRAMLIEPDLIIYDSIFEGLNPEMLERLTKLTEKFHLEKPGRTSIYISSNALSIDSVKADQILRLSN